MKENPLYRYPHPLSMNAISPFSSLDEAELIELQEILLFSIWHGYRRSGPDASQLSQRLLLPFVLRLLAACWARRSNGYFYYSSLRTEQLSPLICQRIQAACYRLFDVLKSFFYTIALGVAPKNCRTAYYIATLFSHL